MKRGGRLKRKMSMRDAYFKKMKARGIRTTFVRNGNRKRGVRLKQRKPIKKQGRALRARLRAYFPLADAFLARPENKFCLICTVRREHGENILIQLASEIHHWAGRIGRLLCYVPFFKPSCFGCRRWPHDHPREARDWGLLAPPTQWNVFPGDGRD